MRPPDIVTAYSRAERLALAATNESILPHRGLRRDWEYPAALNAIDSLYWQRFMARLDPSSSVLVIGAAMDSLALYLAKGRGAHVIAVDAGADWPGWDLEALQQWYAGTSAVYMREEGEAYIRRTRAAQFVASGDPAPLWDLGLSVSVLEHCQNDRGLLQAMLEACRVVVVTLECAYPPGDYAWGRGYGVDSLRERLGLDLQPHQIHPLGECLLEDPPAETVEDWWSELRQAPGGELHWPILLAWG